MKTRMLLLTVVVLVGCALTVDAQTVVVPAPAPGTTVVLPPGQAPALATGKYSGNAWTWDSQRNIVTLNDGGRIFRVLVTPDQIARLDHHQRVTVNGTLLGPDPIETVLLPTQPMAAMAAGPAANVEIAGQLGAIESNGTATVQSARGPLRVWVADGAQSRFQAGQNVKVHTTVQPVRMVAVSGAGGQASGPTLAMAPAPIAGDSATVVGRILGVSATGQLTIESPRGPITVWVPDAANYKMGDYVQVQTVVGAS